MKFDGFLKYHPGDSGDAVLLLEAPHPPEEKPCWHLLKAHHGNWDEIHYYYEEALAYQDYTVSVIELQKQHLGSNNT